MRIWSIICALALALIPPSASARSPDCASGTLLRKYVAAGMATFSPEGVLTLQVTTDLHSGFDCGAPDCYGTVIRISMTPVRPGSCRYRKAVVTTEDFNSCPDEAAPSPP
ncbi:MAG: hypothetical protein FWD68_21735 [Alphaproteobacteria bacterium]|nr:hypothetical protein [Alphaproteobacteria bacterium]